MPAGGSSIYTDAEGYQDSLRGTMATIARLRIVDAASVVAAM